MVENHYFCKCGNEWTFKHDTYISDECECGEIVTPSNTEAEEFDVLYKDGVRYKLYTKISNGERFWVLEHENGEILLDGGLGKLDNMYIKFVIHMPESLKGIKALINPKMLDRYQNIKHHVKKNYKTVIGKEPLSDFPNYYSGTDYSNIVWTTQTASTNQTVSD